MTWWVTRKTAPLSMPPEKQTPTGSLPGTRSQPPRDLVRERADVGAADRRGRWKSVVALGVKKRT